MNKSLIRLSFATLLLIGCSWSLCVNADLAQARNTIQVSSRTTASTQPRSKISLSGEWRLQPGSFKPANLYATPGADRNWQAIAVPSNWFLQGQDLSGVVWYSKRFTAEAALKGKVVKLVFEGVDYTADVWLNGHYLGFHEGYFQPFSFLISEWLKPGKENVLVVRVNSPKEESGQSWSLHKRIIKGIFSHHDTRPGGAWSERGQEQNTGGIWAPVYLQVSNQLSIEQVKVTPRVNLSNQTAIAATEVVINYPGKTSKKIQFKLALNPANFVEQPGVPIVQTRILKPGINRFNFQIPSRNPRLWWTWEHGKPNLYQLNVSVLDKQNVLDQAATTFGFRTITFNPGTQAWSLNGKRLFLRGTNYISSQWLSEMTQQRYVHDLTLMKQANINAVRVHAHIEAQEFYRQCDRAGMFVWQDFPLQWGYTEQPEFAQEAVRQAKDMMNVLYNHPSIIAWSLHNEPPWDADWMKAKYADYQSDQNKRLDKTLFKNLYATDPTRYLHAVSGIKEHPWFGWYSGKWTDYAKPTQEALITEFGAQALPNLRSLQRIFSPAELFPDTEAKWQKWSYHNFQRQETFENAKVPMGKNIQEFIQNTQQYQSQLTQLAAESYRRQRFSPVTSIFQFMFVENWPSVNWGIVDYWRIPKPGYDALKTAYQPVLPSIAWKQQQWRSDEPVSLSLWVINDLWTQFPNAHLTYQLRYQQTVIESQTLPMLIAPDSGKKVQDLHFQPLKPGNYELAVTLTDQNQTPLGRNAFKFTVSPSLASHHASP